MTTSEATKTKRAQALSRIFAAGEAASAIFQEGENEPTSKKRKRVSPKKSTESISSTSQPPTHILVIDNGGDSLKYGLVTADKPEIMPNLTAKLRHQWAIMIGDEVTKTQPNQVEYLTRSTERSHITNLGNQVQVWKRILDLMRIQVPFNSEASQAFGWKNNRQTTKDAPLHNPQQMAVLVLLAPSSPRSTMESMYSIWFEDFHFGHVGFASSAIFAAAKTPTLCSCVVDLGWSATHVVPMVNNRVIMEGLRRIPVGGRHLVNLWKYYMSYRQWNLMDSEFILRDVYEQLSYVSMDFVGDMKLAQRVRSGKRPFDRHFVLPDFQNTFKGSVRQAEAPIGILLLDAVEEMPIGTEKSLGSDFHQSEHPVREGTETEETDDNDEGENQIDDEIDVDSDDEDDDEQRKLRLLRQRTEDERRKRELDQEEQLLQVSVERFAIPEVLFQPSDAGFSPDMAGLPQAVAQAIDACPKYYQAALFGSIHLVGGLANLPNLRERLERDLRCICPSQYDIRITIADSPVEQAWMGASKWAQGTPLNQWSISREEYFVSKNTPSQTKPWRRLYHSKEGCLL